MRNPLLKKPLGVWLWVLSMCLPLGSVHGQNGVPLFLANERTTIRDIDFTFEEDRTFDPEQLLEQVATQEPGFWNTVRRVLPFVDARTYLLDRIELQKDVVRLRRFYRQNGFLEPWIEYDDSELDTTSNSIRVVFHVAEGPPLIIQDVGFFGPDGGYAVNLFEEEMREHWIDFRDRTSFRTGDRYTEFDRIRIQDRVLTWLKDRGYAFPILDTETTIDSTAFTADIRFTLDPGPRGVFSEILIEGNESVSREVILRELPFSIGERFSQNDLIEGQRQLFGLNLFRVALADVPPTDETPEAEVDTLQQRLIGDVSADLRQPRDSTVTVRFRVREANLRYVTAQTGYAREFGITLQGQWMHRNFFGGARNLTVSATANTGVLAAPPTNTLASRLYQASVALRQPYVFIRRLSATIEPFVRAERDPLLEESDRYLNINRREYGITSSLLYELLPFRTIGLRYTLTRTTQFTDLRPLLDDPNIIVDELTEERPFSKSVISLNGTFGRVNNFLNPRRGFLIRPYVEQAGAFLGSEVEYLKGGGEAVAYIPLTRTMQLGTRLAFGRMRPLGRSLNQFIDPVIEDRFDPIRLYAGGASDVRGWANQMLGPKRPRPVLVQRGDTTEVARYIYEPIGGEARLSGNIELRMPFPGLGSRWRSAVFLDFGQVSAERVLVEREDGAVFEPRDDARISLNPSDFQYGTGGGIRYETPVGYIRLDIAYKLNPTDIDLQDAEERFLYEDMLRRGLGTPDDLPEPDKKYMGRFNLHLSLGQTF